MQHPAPATQDTATQDTDTQDTDTQDTDTQDTDTQDTRSFHSSRTIIVAVSVFLNVAGFTIILPVIPFLVARYVQSDLVGLYVGLIVSVYALGSFCSAPVLGLISDHYGRRPVLILSLLGSAVGYLIFGIGGALWVLFLGRIVDGFTAGNISTVYAYVADTHAPADRGRIFGMLGAVAGLGFMVGPVAGGALGALSPTAPLFTAAALTLANALWVYLALPESVQRGVERPAWNWRQMNPVAQLADVLRRPALRIPFLAAFSFFFAGAMLQSNFAVYLKEVFEFGPIGIGWTLFGVGIMDIVSQGLLTRALLPRLGAAALSKLGLLVNAAGFAILACLIYLPHVGYLAGGLLIFTLGDGLFQPAMSAIIANAAPDNVQGLVQGANQAQQSMARMLGPLLAAVLSPIALNAPYWMAMIIVVAGFVALKLMASPARTVD
jgi:MFS transporter, DHA1 family, tetracycline resistance protein